MQTLSEVSAHDGMVGVAGLGLDQQPFPLTQSQSAWLPFGCEHVAAVCLSDVQLQKHDSGTTLQKSVVASRSTSASALPAATSIASSLRRTGVVTSRPGLRVCARPRKNSQYLDARAHHVTSEQGLLVLLYLAARVSRVPLDADKLAVRARPSSPRAAYVKAGGNNGGRSTPASP
jgi:hypothetical protein